MKRVDASAKAAAFPLRPDQVQILATSLPYPRGANPWVGQVRLHLSRTLDPEWFKAAWQDITAHLPSLMAGIYEDDGGTYLQYTPPHQSAPLEVKDLHHLSRPKADELLTVLADAFLRHDFSFSSPPLCRMALVRTSDQASCLIWTFHRIITPVHVIRSVLTGLMLGCDGRNPGIVQSPPPGEAPVREPGGRPLCISHNVSDMLAGYRHHSFFPHKPRMPEGPGQEKRQNAFLPLTTAAETLSLSPDAAKNLTRFSATFNLGPDIVFMGTWALLLGHYSGKNDVLFGCRAAAGPGGDASGLNSVILPVRHILRPSQIFSEYLGELGALWQEIQARPEAALAAMETCAGTPFGPEAPETVLLFESAALEKQILPPSGSHVVTDLRIRERLPFPMTVAIETASCAGICVRYDRRLFQADFIKTLLERFSQLLERGIETGRQRLSDLSYRSPKEEEPVSRTPDPDTDTESARIHHLFDIQATANPDTVAVSMGNTETSYRELKTLTNRIARFLIEDGLSPGARAALVMPPGIYLVAFALGVLKAGGAYLHVDPNTPGTAEIIAASEAAYLIIPTPPAAPLKAGLRTIVTDSRTLDRIRSTPETPPARGPIPPKPLAVLYHRSDSTSDPVLDGLTHDALSRYIREAGEHYEFQAGETFCLYPSSASGTPLETLYPALTSGATVLLPPTPSLSEDFLSFCRKARPSVIRLPSSAFRTASGMSPELPDSLRLVILSETTVTWSSESVVKNLPAGTRLIYVLDPARDPLEMFYAHPGPVGEETPLTPKRLLGFPTTRAVIFNELGRPALPHVTGKLFVGSRLLDDTHGTPSIRPAGPDAPPRLLDTGWEAKTDGQGVFEIVPPPPEAGQPTFRNSEPIILIGNSMGAARGYHTADKNGHPFFHAPIFIHLYGKDRSQALSMGIPEIAAACVDEIIRAFHQGPFILIGECQNSIVAHEAAYRLTQMNHRVSQLIIIDENWQAAPLPDRPGRYPGKLVRLLTRFRQNGISGARSLLADKVKRTARSWYIALDELQETLFTLVGKTPPPGVQFRLMEALFYRACQANPYTPPVYDGDVSLLYSKNWKTDYKPQLNRFYTGRVRTEAFDIGHSDWFTPGQIRSILNHIDRKTPKRATTQAPKGSLEDSSR